NPLRCPNCDDYRYLRIKKYGFKTEDEKSGIGLKIPFYDCDRCSISIPIALNGEILFGRDAISYYQEKTAEIFPELKEGEFVELRTPFEGKKFEAYDTMGFTYDSQDYYYIPGLYRSFDEGFLCPVFFDKELLLYYNNHPEYRVVFASYSRLHIFDKNGDRIIFHGFGINRDGLIVCWLGDLDKEFKKSKNERHKKIFLAFNEASNHDIVSDYYFNQIEANFMEPDNEGQLFELRNAFDSAVIFKGGENITHIDLAKVIDEYKHPVINESDQINSSYIKLNSLLIESFSIENLKKLILQTSIKPSEIKGLKGLKLFEKFVINYLKIEDGNMVVSPLYVLYDLRVLAGHIKDSKYDEKVKSCKLRLNLSESATEMEVYNCLIQKLIDMYKILKLSLI
ncbi:MAG: hypothetical protein DI539_17880, partial [Flavobacterium psychrophilum]